MRRVGRILQDRLYRRCLAENAAREVDRPFCRHDFQHMLDVARISYIMLVEGGGLDDLARECCCAGRQSVRDVVYAAGLLHDIGRFRQYDCGEDHAAAGALLARPILERAGFSFREVEVITRAIAAHRRGDEEGGLLGRVLCRADDLARPCAFCRARGDCYKADRMETAQELLVY